MSLDRQLERIDADFGRAGLTRSRRGESLRLNREARKARATPEALARPPGQMRRAPNGAGMLAVPGWEFDWLWSGFSTRLGGLSRAYGAEGELNLGFTAEDERETVRANRRRLAEAVTGNADTPLVTARQFHSNLILRVGMSDAGLERPRRADGLITDVPGILLAVQVADCIPVLVADRRRHVVAAFHAGWRGTVRRIVENGVGRMRLELGSRPADLIAAIGPGVGRCCYAVGEDVLSEFTSQFSNAADLFREVYDTEPVRLKYPMLFLTQRAPGHSPIGPHVHLDLVEANRRQLLDAGLKASAIRIAGGCTSCHPELFYSHRSSRGRAGRMMGVIGIRKSVS
jgi:YfiH family protein